MQMYSNPLSKTVRLTLLLAGGLTLGSCYNYRIATQAQPGTEVTKFTAHSLFWGLLQKPPTILTPNCDTLQVNGMSEVTMRTNLGYSIITVATLGIWSPMRVEWKCSKPCKKEGEL